MPEKSVGNLLAFLYVVAVSGAELENNTAGFQGFTSFIVPKNWYYRVSNQAATSPTITYWAELRA